LGLNDTSTRLTPVKVNVPHVDIVACGDSYTMIVGVDGGLSACGFNFNGQLGDGTTTRRTSAVKITVPPVATGTGTTSSSATSSVSPGTYNLSVDILSTTHLDFGKINNPFSITNNNPPRLTLSNKNSAANLSSIWTQTYIPKGSILQFNLNITNNAPVSSLLVNLTVEKQ
jgi:alpha-tubulin suppressor-like RCC1 family protein